MLVSEMRIGGEAGFRVPNVIEQKMEAEQAASSRNGGGTRVRPTFAARLIGSAYRRDWVKCESVSLHVATIFGNKRHKSRVFFPGFVTPTQRKRCKVCRCSLNAIDG
ncbi:hypothetical protein BYI23_B008410 [Burkholderia sp. YI23]|nr:hypothetical protein BYI23_B008410 [Burkholderia sp. YI23]